MTEQESFSLENESDRAAFQAFNTYKGALVQAHMNAFTKYATLAMQGAFLLNGSVGCAAFSQRAESAFPLICCAVGALFAILSAGAAYFSQNSFFSLDMKAHAQEVRRYFLLSPVPDSEFHKTMTWGNRWKYTAVVLCLSSLVLFVGGALAMLWSNF